MKLHDLRPAAGAHRAKTRVGRGIAAGKGKTAGRGTKGQKARAGGSIPPWFEGGQTPLHVRIPKLRGFRNPLRVEYEVVNIGRIAALVAAGRLEAPEDAAPRGRGKARPAPITVNQDVLRATGLVRSLDRPLKILGHGDCDVALFIVADAFTKSARAKIEAAGGTAQLLETPSGPLAALGVDLPVEPEPVAVPEEVAAKPAKVRKPAKASAAPEADVTDVAEPVVTDVTDVAEPVVADVTEPVPDAEVEAEPPADAEVDAGA
jgi:large subunit ribosomal protein L15